MGKKVFLNPAHGSEGRNGISYGVCGRKHAAVSQLGDAVSEPGEVPAVHLHIASRLGPWPSGAISVGTMSRRRADEQA